jgi:hypothetical protein
MLPHTQDIREIILMESLSTILGTRKIVVIWHQKNCHHMAPEELSPYGTRRTVTIWHQKNCHHMAPEEVCPALCLHACSIDCCVAALQRNVWNT